MLKFLFNTARNSFTFQVEHKMKIRSFIMLKKIIALFRRPVPEKPYTPPAPVRCYQPNLPFD